MIVNALYTRERKRVIALEAHDVARVVMRSIGETGALPAMTNDEYGERRADDLP
jgi:hypothetical protein